jgi:hypothetical protein
MNFKEIVISSVLILILIVLIILTLHWIGEMPCQQCIHGDYIEVIYKNKTYVCKEIMYRCLT